MFTGIIEQKATLTQKSNHAQGARLSFQLATPMNDVALGESIAVNGACLTVVEPFAPQSLSFDLSPETLEKTSLGRLALGEFVNIERAMQANARFSGHVVSGHVDGTGTLQSVEQLGDYYRIKLQIPEALSLYCVSKGSICVDGISLTINAIQNNTIELMIIPHTWLVTNLSQAQAGTRVNIECDYFAKLFVNHMEKNSKWNPSLSV